MGRSEQQIRGESERVAACIRCMKSIPALIPQADGSATDTTKVIRYLEDRLELLKVELEGPRSLQGPWLEH